MKTILFVCYGSGHVRMVVPVAQAVVAAGLAKVKVLALTTAAPVVRAAQLDMLQIKDFVRPGNDADAAALQTGRRLMRDMPAVADPDETTAYLGLSYAELEEDVGAQEAARRYARDGRQAFLPRRLLARIVRDVAPHLVFATNSPRAERAAIEAARVLGIASICLVDLFAIDEVQWIGQPGFADRICVLNPMVKQFLTKAGRSRSEVSVTGNPAFDALNQPASVAAGQRLRQVMGWQGSKVLVWPVQVEPAIHPFNGKPGDSSLPRRALASVIDWVLAQDDRILCVRPRAGENAPEFPAHPRVVVMGQDVPLPSLLHAADLVVALSSTVSLEGHLAGTSVVQILGSVFDDAMPLADYGIADEAVDLECLPDALQRWTAVSRRPAGNAVSPATSKVVEVIGQFL